MKYQQISEGFLVFVIVLVYVAGLLTGYTWGKGKR